MFPSSSQGVSQDFPTSSHALAKLELPYIHKLQKREGREGKVGAVGEGKHKGASIGECSIFRKAFVLGQTNWPLQNKIKLTGHLMCKCLATF